MLTSVANPHRLPGIGSFAACFSLVRSWSDMLVREIEIRREQRRLAALDDGMLHDLGLGRSEVDDAVRHGRERVSRGAGGIRKKADLATGLPAAAWTEWR